MKPFIRRPVPLLFTDLDGTVRKGKEELGRFVHGPGDVVLYPGAVRRLTQARDDGYRIVGITNQGGIALGLASAAAMLSASDLTDAKAGRPFDLIKMCPHHPDADDPELRDCLCRKPRIGMLVDAISQLRALHLDEYYPLDLALFVGDRPEDEICANSAGIRFLDAARWRAGA